MAAILAAALYLLFLPSTTTTADPSAAVLNACRAARFPTPCAAALSPSAATTASPLLSAALSAASTALAPVHTAAAALLSASASNPPRAAAAKDCVDHLALSARRLAASSSAASLADARALAGAALLHQYDCWSALKYVNTSRPVADAMAAVVSLQELTSNALAIAAALQRYGDDMSLWAPPQTERDGYWGDGAAAGDVKEGSLRPGLSPDVVPNLTVCKDGSCDYRTVQEAVDAAPEYVADRFVVRIKAGVYEETVRVPFEKPNLAFVGDGMGATVITGSANVGHSRSMTTYDSATVGVVGDGFMARDITFENSAGVGAHQAVAFRSDSDRSVLESVEFRGHQDTLYAHSMRQLYRMCHISGTVDFIFGNSAAVFDRCVVEVVSRQEGPQKAGSNAVTAHGRTDPGQATGFVFSNCIINGSDEYLTAYKKKPGAHRVYLGRPWKEYSRTVYVNCFMGEIVRPEGWLPWREDFALDTLFYGEYGSLGPGANLSARVAWSNQIPEEHVGVYSMHSFIQGDEWVPSEQ